VKQRIKTFDQPKYASDLFGPPCLEQAIFNVRCDERMRLWDGVCDSAQACLRGAEGDRGSMWMEWCIPSPSRLLQRDNRAQREHALLSLCVSIRPAVLMDAMARHEEISLVANNHCHSGGPSGGRAGFGWFYSCLEIRETWRHGTRHQKPGRCPPRDHGGELDAVMKSEDGKRRAAYLRSITTKRGPQQCLGETAVRESKSFTEKESTRSTSDRMVRPMNRLCW